MQHTSNDPRMKSSRTRVGLTAGATVLIAGALLVAGALCAVSCSGGSGGPSELSSSGSIGNSTSSHAIHVLARRPSGTTAQLNFGPGTEARFNAGSGGLASQTVGAQGLQLGGAGPSLQKLGTGGTSVTDAGIFMDAGGTPVTAAPSVDDPGNEPWDTAWALVWRAAIQCGGVYVSGGTQNKSDLPWLEDHPGYLPANELAANWFYYDFEDESCASRLAIEQNLVCVADKLAQISDAVGMTVWPSLSSADGGVFTYSGSEDAAVPTTSDKYVEWDIPPQADADRFILRDLAIYVLGLIPTVDAFSDITFPAPIPPKSTCAQAFAWATGTTGGAPNAMQLKCGSKDSAWTVALFNAGNVATEPDGGPGNSYPTLPPSNLPVCDLTVPSNPAHNVPQIAESALVIEAQILRGAGRLLHDVIRRDVYSDLAASAQASAQALDPQAGNQLAWGVNLSPPGQEPYGSISHAARVLMGRWEIGESTDVGSPFPASLTDPTSFEAPALGIVSGGTELKPSLVSAAPPYGPDFEARYDDLPIRTPGEQTAVQLLEQTGLIVPSSSIPGGATGSMDAGSGASASSLRQALAAQLLLQVQTQNSPPGFTPNPNDPEAAVFQNAVNALADAEVTFAFLRVLRTWRMLTNQGDPPPAYFTSSATTWPVAGLSRLPASAISPTITQLAGTVIAGGLSRSRLVTDTIARAGGMLQVSQWTDGTDTNGTTAPAPGAGWNSGWTPWGIDQGAALSLPITNGSASSIAATLPTVVFQDAFHIGQALERRLVVIDQLALADSGTLATSPTAGADPVARGAIAELKSWAGSTMVHAWPTLSVTQQGANSPPAITTLNVLVEGMVPSDLGISSGSPTSSQLESAFGFVYGPPWMAECAAGVRTDCPAAFSQSVVSATSATDLSVTPVGPLAFTSTGLQAYGVLNSAYLLTVPLGTAGLAVPITPLPVAPTATDAHLYMILMRDPTSPLGRGRVLGVLQATGSTITVSEPPCIVTGGVLRCREVSESAGNIVNFVDAPMQRELLHDALDLGKWVGAAPPSLGDPSTAAIAGYCVDGVPRDIFVPLDNELVSGTQTYEDSWQHYLDLAQAAAATADTLGQQLIANDLQISENEEAAGAAFANLCGDFGVLSGATVSKNGTVTPAADDATGTACLSPSMVDVAYLGAVPPLTCGTNMSQTQCFQQDVLKCGQSGALPSPLCSKSPLMFAPLNLLPIPPSSPPPSVTPTGSSPECDSLQAAITTLPTGLKGQDFYNAINGAFSPSQMNLATQSTQMFVDLFDEWWVTVGGQMLMSSTDDRYWPACLVNGCSGLTGPAKTQATYLNTAFRWCPNSVTPTPAQLLAVPLGCDGPGNGSAATTAEMNMLKWRVTQGMWMIGVSAGQMPSGMFNIPVPVALELQPTPSITTVPYFVAYDGVWSPRSGTLNIPGTTQHLSEWGRSAGSSNTDIATFGTAYDVAPAFGAFTDHAPQEIPSWYIAMYTNAIATGGVKHSTVFGSESWMFNGYLYHQMSEAGAAVTAESPPGVPAVPYPIAMADLEAAGSVNLTGIACQNPYGESTHNVGIPASSLTGYTLWQLVATAKGELAGDIGGQGVAHYWYSGESCGGGINETLDGMVPVSGFSCPLMSTQAGSGSTWDIPIDQLSMTSSTSATGSGFWFSHFPMSSAPYQRVTGFLGAMPPNGTCASIRLLAQPAAISCAAQAASLTLPSSGPPPITNVEDISTLATWLSQAQGNLARALSNVYVTNVPQTVVTALQSKSIGAGAAAGAAGSAALEMEQSLQAIPSNWALIVSNIGTLQQSVVTAQLAIQAAQITNETADAQLMVSATGIQANMAQAVLGAVSQSVSALDGAAASAGVSLLDIGVAVASASTSTSADETELSTIASEYGLAGQAENVATEQALGALTSATFPAWAQIQTSVDNVRASIATVAQDANQLQLTQGQAAYQLAVGTGQDFVMVAGQEVPIPVDTVLRRQASATEERYQIALTNAKALAYMARRAIEQRIGVPLDALTQSIGPLDAPAAWADDICSLQGVNYASLSTAASVLQDGGGIDGSVNQTAINQFADAWVGDYVTKLQNFVTYYNVQYPSHQGDDTAVLSLRYDLLGPDSQCEAQGPNLLLNSGQLDAPYIPSVGSQGWQEAPCAAWSGKCLTVLNGDLLPAPSTGPDGASVVAEAQDAAAAGVQSSSAGVTWLADVTGTGGADAAASDAGVGDAGVVDASAPFAAPSNTVFQSLTLSAGSYVLSWWDQARDPSGNVVHAGSTASVVPYVVDVVNGSGSTIAGLEPTPYQPAPGDAGGTSLWSTRNQLAFTVSQPGTYAIAFGASDLTGLPGSVAIADVQLEVSSSGNPTPYVATSLSTMVTTYECPMTDSDLRAAFIHTCDATGTCWYDLAAPMIIDTGALNAGQSPLGAKLAAGNYNYRNVDVALNLVGTSVHTCVNDQDPNCYGSGYIQYTLNHDATNAGIVGYDGNERYFNFGVASINHGKALAAERYLTMPLATADQQLVTQPGIQHIELSGRPLDGAYSLRIWDSADLNWGALQDVQIIFDYEYWSSIIANGNVQGRHPPRPHGSHPKPTIRLGTPRRHH
jgi:hypothetical protein